MVNTRLTRLALLMMLVLVVVPAIPLISPEVRAATQEKDPESPASIRAQIEAMYAEWGRARISLDRKTIEKILAPDFFVLLDDEKMTRAQFIERVTRVSRTGGLIRFDANIMTIQGDNDGWTVVITEKIEYKIVDADGKPQTAYSFWVTRDGCRKVDEQWQVTYSEAIGYETWDSGKKPPFMDW